MRRRHLVVGLAVIAALAIAVPVFGITNAVSPPVKKAIKKEVTRQIAKLNLPQGPAGQTGAQGNPGPEGKEGPVGTPDTSNFYDKAQSDARYVQGNPTGSFSSAVYTNHIVLSNSGAYATVLALPGGLEVQCSSNDSTQSFTKIESPSAFVGNLQYNTTTPGYIENTGVRKGASTAAFGGGTYNVARYQIMDSEGATAPNRVWAITVTVLKNSIAGQISGGPHCLAEAVAGPA